jgi:hypothetical protein
MAVTVSTADQKPVKVSVDVQGVGMDEVAARKFAQDLRCSLRYQLGITGDDENMLVVEVTADAAPPASLVTPESPVETPATPVAKASAEEIAAMTPDEYRAAKAAGRI